MSTQSRCSSRNAFCLSPPPGGANGIAKVRKCSSLGQIRLYRRGPSADGSALGVLRDLGDQSVGLARRNWSLTACRSLPDVVKLTIRARSSDVGGPRTPSSRRERWAIEWGKTPRSNPRCILVRGAAPSYDECSRSSHRRGRFACDRRAVVADLARAIGAFMAIRIGPRACSGRIALPF